MKNDRIVIHSFVSPLLLLLTLFFAPLLANAAQGVPGPPEEGPGQGPPEGKGGGRPDDSGTKKGDLYGDLYIIDRDADGVPVTYVWVDGVPSEDPAGFVNPITNGEQLTPCYPAANDGGCLIPLDTEGEVPEEFLPYVQEVDFGRLSLSRSPDKVLRTQLADALALLSGAGVISLDPAGRLVVDGTAIDSPLQNMALYQELLIEGELMDKNVEIILPAALDSSTFLHNASSLFGGAADKEGSISVDLVIYLNSILKIPAATNQSTLDGNYFDFRDFEYDRGQTYPGCITYLDPANGYAQTTDSVLNTVFNGEAYSGGNVGAFAQSADDARAVIEFIHGNTVITVDSQGEASTCEESSETAVNILAVQPKGNGPQANR